MRISDWSSDVCSSDLLAQIFGGALVLGLRLDLGKLGDAVHQPGDILPEQPEYLLRRGDGVLDRVVKDRGRDRLVVEVEVGQYARDLDRVGKIRVARRPELRAMRFHRTDRTSVVAGKRVSVLGDFGGR